MRGGPGWAPLAARSGPRSGSGRGVGGRARRVPVSRRAACMARPGPARRSSAAPARVLPAAEGAPPPAPPRPPPGPPSRRSWQRAGVGGPYRPAVPPGSAPLAPFAEGRGGGPGPRPEVRGAAGLALPRRTPALKSGLKREGKSCFVVCAFPGFGGFSWDFSFLAIRKLNPRSGSRRSGEVLP